MDDILPDTLLDWDSGDGAVLTDEVVEDGGGLVGAEGQDAGDGGDDGGLLDDGGILDDGLYGDGGGDSSGGDAADGGELIDDGGYSGEDIFVWDGEVGGEFTDIAYIFLEPLIPDDYTIEDGGTEVPADPPVVEEGSEGDVGVIFWYGCVDYPCLPDDAIV